QTATGKESSNPFMAGSLPKLYCILFFIKYAFIANSLAGVTEQLSSGNSFALAVAKYSSRGIFITSSGNALKYFIPNT
nr:hypothetical protein [Tanacetum cinerariifolium]